MTGRESGRTHEGTKGRAALAEISLLLAAFFVGTDFVSVKYALQGLPPLALVPLRYVAAGLLILGLLRLVGNKYGSGLTLRDLPVVAGLGLVGVTLNQIGYTVGLSLTSGSNGALIFATAPVWGLLLGIVLGLERGSWRGALGLGLAGLLRGESLDPGAVGATSWLATAWAPRRPPRAATCSCA